MYKVLTGAQMYSVRTLTQTQEGLDATLKALKEMGYTDKIPPSIPPRFGTRWTSTA